MKTLGCCSSAAPQYEPPVVKIFGLCDAKTFFTGNLKVYCSKQPTGPYEVSNSPADMAERLISHLKGTCRNLTTDNWYTSYTLAMISFSCRFPICNLCSILSSIIINCFFWVRIKTNYYYYYYTCYVISAR